MLLPLWPNFQDFMSVLLSYVNIQWPCACIWLYTYVYYIHYTIYIYIYIGFPLQNVQVYRHPLYKPLVANVGGEHLKLYVIVVLISIHLHIQNMYDYDWLYIFMVCISCACVFAPCYEQAKLCHVNSGTEVLHGCFQVATTPQLARFA